MKSGGSVAISAFQIVSISAFREVPMAGFEPARAYSAQRILSPLRLPFRHIG
jgi:hypothetical protein